MSILIDWGPSSRGGGNVDGQFDPGGLDCDQYRPGGSRGCLDPVRVLEGLGKLMLGVEIPTPTPIKGGDTDQYRTFPTEWSWYGREDSSSHGILINVWRRSARPYWWDLPVGCRNEDDIDIMEDRYTEAEISAMPFPPNAQLVRMGEVKNCDPILFWVPQKNLSHFRGRMR